MHSFSEMGSISEEEKPHPHPHPHVVCIPFPAQGHINPMMKLAKLLHHKGGVHISFVNTHYNHNRLLKSRGPASLSGLPDFRFYSIPDGLPSIDADATQDIPSLCQSTPKHSLEPFCDLISMLNESSDVPPVSCIVSDGVMSFTLKAADRFGVPEVLFWTSAACGFLAYSQYKSLVEKGLIPLKDMSDVTNGYLDTTLNWIQGMKDIKLRDFPSSIRTTNIDDTMVNFLITSTAAVPKAYALIINTFDALEHDALQAITAIQPRTFTLGPLNLMINHIQDETLKSIGSNLWKEESECMNWLDTKQPKSVVYVNFGSITVMTKEEITEFAWGLANSCKNFLWVIRPDIVAGDTAMLPDEFGDKTKGRGMLANWCPQEQVLNHSAIGGFLTHSGWNSTIESISRGVPVICWPFFAEQHTNRRYSCVEWGVGMEIDKNVKRDGVEGLLRELMDGENGKVMREKAMGWRDKAHEAVAPGGSSYLKFDELFNLLLGHSNSRKF